jgi:hypothetical protein
MMLVQRVLSPTMRLESWTLLEGMDRRRPWCADRIALGSQYRTHLLNGRGPLT